MSASSPWSPIPLEWSAPAGDRLSVAVVGGSTPFISPLIAAMSDASARDGQRSARGQRWDLRLLGRDPVSLAIVERHAQQLLSAPHTALATDDVGAALDGADIVIVQPRVGGLAERAIDEDLAESVGAPADEGLGPGGLRAIIRTAPAMRGLAEDLRRRAPGAFNIAFTNPLSSTVSHLHAEGVNAVGVCELPLVTAYEIAARLGVERQSLTWTFTGLSHRGFIRQLTVAGEDRFADLMSALRKGDRRDVGGIDVDVIEHFGAVPLKYHAMLSGAQRPAAGRGRQLMQIRDQALVQLDADPTVVPPALAQRDMPWYDEAVVPIMLALAGRPSNPPGSYILDLACDDGVVREVVSDVGTTGVVPIVPDKQPSADTMEWVARFEAHERALNEFLAEPTVAQLVCVLALDPATPTASIEPLVTALIPAVQRLADAPTAHSWLRA
jgi:6-phospho-beta-glucosidase